MPSNERRAGRHGLAREATSCLVVTMYVKAFCGGIVQTEYKTPSLLIAVAKHLKAAHQCSSNLGLALVLAMLARKAKLHAIVG